VFGVFCWFVLSWFVVMPFWVLGAVLMGAIFVDLDSWNSKVGRKFRFLSWFFRHRGFLHSLTACLLLSLFAGLFSLWLCFGFFVGCVSHLFLDALTLRGVALFWPFGLRLRGFIRSGGWIEDVVFVLLLGLDIVFVAHKFL
jgi:inner membrane protein